MASSDEAKLTISKATHRKVKKLAALREDTMQSCVAKLVNDAYEDEIRKLTKERK